MSDKKSYHKDFGIHNGEAGRQTHITTHTDMSLIYGLNNLQHNKHKVFLSNLAPNSC